MIRELGRHDFQSMNTPYYKRRTLKSMKNINTVTSYINSNLLL